MAALAIGDRTATYARVSTADQSPDLQHDGLRAFADRAGLSLACDVTVGHGGTLLVGRSNLGGTAFTLPLPLDVPLLDDVPHA